MRTRPQLRRLHRALVPLAALPIILTALSGSLYGLLSAQGIEAFWLMTLHNGNTADQVFAGLGGAILVLKDFASGSRPKPMAWAWSSRLAARGRCSRSTASFSPRSRSRAAA